MRVRSIRIAAFITALVLLLSVGATALAAYDTIPYGEQSTSVRKMQDKLKERGYYNGDVDGKFGPLTLAAVKAFQKAVGITVDGKPGNKTLTALYDGVSAINKTNNSELKHTTKPTNPRTLYYGCTGSRVESLQRALRLAGFYGGEVDGVYGELTYDAVRRYQSANGLKVDGMAGTKTINSLNGATGVGVSSSFLLTHGSKGTEVANLKHFLRNKGYAMTAGDELFADDVAGIKQWQADTGRDQTGSITESVYNDIVLGKIV